MGNIGPQQLLIVAIIFIVLFGAKKLPETAKGLAQSLRVFKKELRPEDEAKTEGNEQIAAPTTETGTAEPASAQTTNQAATTQPAAAEPTAEEQPASRPAS